MGDLGKSVVFAAVTVLTGVILFITARANKVAASDGEKIKTQTKALRQWGAISLSGALIISVFYFVFVGQDKMIPVFVYGGFLLVNGFILKYRVGKIEKAFYVPEKKIDEEKDEEKEFIELEEKYKAALKKREEKEKKD